MGSGSRWKGHTGRRPFGENANSLRLENPEAPDLRS